jgi:hypothetical protein
MQACGWELAAQAHAVRCCCSMQCALAAPFHAAAGALFVGRLAGAKAAKGVRQARGCNQWSDFDFDLGSEALA